jgi:hypothetical protein
MPAFYAEYNLGMGATDWTLRSREAVRPRTADAFQAAVKWREAPART